MNGQEHFVALDRIHKCLIQIRVSYHPPLAVPYEDVSTQIY